MAHPELNSLMTALSPLAEKMLLEFGEFLPYGGYLRANGEIVECGVDDGGKENSKSQVLLEILSASFRKRAATDDVLAFGLCIDVKVTKPGGDEKIDAIQYILEHKDGESIDVFRPYNLDASGEVVLGSLFSVKAIRRFYPK